MHFTVPSGMFTSGVEVVLPATTTGSLPVLEMVRITAEAAGTVEFAATDLDIVLKMRIDADVHEPGAVCVPGKLFFDYLKKLGKDVLLHITLDGTTLHLVVGDPGSEQGAEFKGLEVDEFPSSPMTLAVPLGLTRDQLLEANRVAFAAAADNTRPILAGVYMQTQAGGLHYAAADGFSLAWRTVPCEAGTALDVNIPAMSVVQLHKILTRLPVDMPLTIGMRQDGNAFLVLAGDPVAPRYALMTRTIDGKYPDFRRIVELERNDVAVRASKKALDEALDRTMLFTNKDSIIIVTLAGTRLLLRPHRSEIGKNTEPVPVTMSGKAKVKDELTMSLNGKFFQEALDSIPTEQVEIAFPTTPMSPPYLRPVGMADGTYVAVVMPMTVR